MTRLRLVVSVLGVLLATAAFAAVAPAGDEGDGFQTSKAAMLRCNDCRSVTPIMSVGDTLPGGYMFEAIPDGIAVLEHGDDDGNGVDVLVNHELSLVPFPSTRQDPSNALVSKLRLNQDAEVVRGEYVIRSGAGYQRLCSNFLVDQRHGFSRPFLFTNEEARDLVRRREDSWDQPGISYAEFPRAEQAGVVVMYDVRSGAHRPIYGMGRHNHENSVGVPGYGYPVVLSGDDTFDAPASQLYLYTASRGEDVWEDKGKLYAFVSDNPAINDYGDITSGMPPVSGRFIEVPRDIATGKLNGNLSARDVTSADFGYPPPPSTAIPDGPQWVLEHWSNLNNVFQFIRIEDTATDRRNPRIMYIADTGEPRARPNATTGRLERAPSGFNGTYMNGRLFKLELGANPLVGAKLSILPSANFDLGGYANRDVPHQPDNMETVEGAIYFQEDPGSHNGSSPAVGYPPFPDATNARIWRYNLRTGRLRAIAEVRQDVPGAPTTLAKGAWESSGIVDASSAFGRGAFLVDIEAHGWDVPAGPGDDAPAVRQREQGQLLLIRVENP